MKFKCNICNLLYFVVAFIIVINTIEYSLGIHSYYEAQGGLLYEVFASVNKLIVYAGPLLFATAFLKRQKISQIFPGLYRWFKADRVYVLWLVWALALLCFNYFVDSGSSRLLFIYPLFFVLVTNSLVEEAVFRGYFLDQLKKLHSFRRANSIQALGFAVAHIPFYAFAVMSRGPLSWYGFELPVIALVAVMLVNPFVLGLVRGYVVNKSNSLWPTIVLHSIHNGVLLFA